MVNFDFTKVTKAKKIPTDPSWSNPVSFFYKLVHPEIKDLYPIQRDVLETWFTAFKANENDKLISLDTGAGKTLIGLLIAEAIKRKTDGKVLYLCSNNLLGKQVLDEAKKYGIETSSYLKIGTDRPQWVNESLFLDNKNVCITTYDALLNSRSRFKGHEIKGIIFDDAHLSLDRLDNQFKLEIADIALIKKITDIFKTSEMIKDKIHSIQDGDPFPLILIPPLEWHNQHDAIQSILEQESTITNSLAWLNLKEKIPQTFCFVSANKMEISLLYPNIKDHFALSTNIQRVYLSATLPNLDDITRMFGVTPSKIESKNPDYRPQRLFVFSKKAKFENSDEEIRNNLESFSEKSLVLVPSKKYSKEYTSLNASIAEYSAEVIEKLEEFKNTQKGIFVLANRYDGVDLPGEICHCLVVDGLPFMGSLKTRFFSEYFHNHLNSFLRSILASKLVQAFGRTIRGNTDYSIIFILGDKLNSWIINKDNRKFFKSDLVEDIEIGIRTSDTLKSLTEVTSLAQEILKQTPNWKNFIEEERSNHEIQVELTKKEEETNIEVAQKERKINDYFIAGNYSKCLEAILESEKKIGEYSRPILGLYLSIASICCSEIKDLRISKLSARAFGINPIFGIPAKLEGKYSSLQSQRIIDMKKKLPEFDLSLKNKQFDQMLKELGEFLGFNSIRPESMDDGTLDVCWFDEQKKVVIGLENKVDKVNKTLSKKEIDQCSGHSNWLSLNYPDYNKITIVVGDFDSYNDLASPGNLQYINIQDLERVIKNISQIYAKKTHPEQIDETLHQLNFTLDAIFTVKKVTSLLKKKE